LSPRQRAHLARDSRPDSSSTCAVEGRERDLGGWWPYNRGDAAYVPKKDRRRSVCEYSAPFGRRFLTLVVLISGIGLVVNPVPSQHVPDRCTKASFLRLGSQRSWSHVGRAFHVHDPTRRRRSRLARRRGASPDGLAVGGSPACQAWSIALVLINSARELSPDLPVQVIQARRAHSSVSFATPAMRRGKPWPGYELDQYPEQFRRRHRQVPQTR